MNLHFIGDWKLWQGLALALLLSGGMFWLYRREFRLVPAGVYGWVLPSLRALAVFFIVLMLTEPILRHNEREGQVARVRIFIDASESMTLTDDFMAPHRKLMLASQLGLLRERDFPEITVGRAATLIRLAADETLINMSRPARASKPIAGSREFAEQLRAAFAPLEEVPSDQLRMILGEGGGLLAEKYLDIGGSGVSDLRGAAAFPNQPDESYLIHAFETDRNTGENYGLRLRGYLEPPQTGEYRFLLVSDDSSELYVSTSESPADARLVATVSGFVGYNEWDSDSVGKSPPVALTEGQRYYVEALLKESAGDDHLRVGWRMPDETVRTPIPGRYLSAFALPADMRGNPATDLLTDLLNRLEEVGEGGGMLPGQAADDVKAVASQALEVSESLERALSRWTRQKAEENAQLRKALAKVDAMPRSERVERLLMNPASALLENLSAKHAIELQTLAGEESAILWSSLQNPDPPLKLDLKADAGFTDINRPLADTIQSLREAEGEKDAEAKERTVLVLVSDARHNEGGSPINTAQILSRQNVPVFTVLTGALEEVEDLSILGSDIPDTVFYKDKLAGTLYVDDKLPAGKPLRLMIKDGDETVWNQELTTTGEGRREIEFGMPLEEMVRRQLDENTRFEVLAAQQNLEVVVESDVQERNLENNKDRLRFVANTRKKSVLIVDSRPRWEYRYLAAMFERDDQWESNRVLGEPGIDFELIPRGSGEGVFPSTKEGLFTYDLIIFGDVSARSFEEEELEWIAEFVDRQGGGLILIDGQRGNLRSLQGGPLEPLLPVEHQDRAAVETPPSLRLAAGGLRQAFMALGADGEDAASVWRELRPPHRLAPVSALPGAEVMLEAGSEEAWHPGIVYRPYGSGKVLYFAFDESWRWRYRVADLHHVRFWNQAADWTMIKPFMVRDDHVSIDIGKTSFKPNERIEIRARVKDKDGHPLRGAEVVAEVLREGVVTRRVALTERPNTVGIYGGEAVIPEGGEFALRLRVDELDKDDLRASVSFAVEPPKKREFAELDADEDLAREISAVSGGMQFREEDLPYLASRLEPFSEGRIVEVETPIWQTYFWFIPVIGLLTLEWILRKRAGLM